MRGKRMATPDLWRVERCRPSNATSNTRPNSRSARTERTGSEALDRVVAHELVDLLQLLVGEAEIGLAHRGQRTLSEIVLAPDPEGVVGIEAGPLAVAALGVHQHRVDQAGIALPLEPRTLGSAGFVDAVPALQHQAFGDGRVALRRLGAQGGQGLPGVERLDRRQVDARAGGLGHERLQPLASLGERQAAQVGLAVQQQVVGADAGGIGLQLLGVHRLAVQPLLQVARSWPAPPSRITSSSPSIAPSKLRASTTSGKVAEMSSPVRV